MENIQLWTTFKICSVNQDSGLWSHSYLGGHGRWNYEWTETATECAYIMLTSHFISFFLCISSNSYKSPHIRESLITVLDSWIPRCRFRIRGTGFLNLSLEFWIPDFNRECDSGFHELHSEAKKEKNRKDNLSLILSSLLSSHRFMLSRVIDTQFSAAAKL